MTSYYITYMHYYFDIILIFILFISCFFVSIAMLRYAIVSQLRRLHLGFVSRCAGNYRASCEKRRAHFSENALLSFVRAFRESKKPRRAGLAPRVGMCVVLKWTSPPKTIVCFSEERGRHTNERAIKLSTIFAETIFIAANTAARIPQPYRNKARRCLQESVDAIYN